jgi:CDP-diacylglycerol---glycerol-3-phosphate 3-phosphatidyltransferase
MPDAPFSPQPSGDPGQPIESVESVEVGGLREEAPSNWNLPNALTTLRILLVPLFGWLLLWERGDEPTYRFWAFAIFTLAILTDRIDGDIARRRNLVTDFGKLMDPIADKALTGMAFVGLSIIGELWWWVTIVVLGRELGITLLRFWVIRHGVMPASRGGKIKTTLQAVALSGLILPLNEPGAPFGSLGDVLWWVAVVVMAAAVVVTVLTGADYVRQAWDQRRERQAADPTALS